MKTPTDEIERLNLAAGALLIEGFVASFRWQSVIFFAIPLMAPKRFGGLTFPLLLFGTALAMAAMWTKWRFKLFIPAVWCFIITIGSLRAIGKMQNIRMTDALGTYLFAMMGISLLFLAATLVRVDSRGWEKEKSLVKSWWQLLMSNPKSEDVIEFRAGLRWFGHHTHRLIKSERYWIDMALRKNWGKLRPMGYGVRRLSEIEFLRLPDGEMNVRI